MGHLGFQESGASDMSAVLWAALTCVLDRVLARLLGALQQRPHQRLQLRPGHLHIQVLRAGRIRSDERQVDIRL
jgi:hypothetical protein